MDDSNPTPPFASCHPRERAPIMSASLYDFLCSFLTPERLRRIEEVLALRTRFVTVVLENMHRTQNASACLRDCEAFGVQDVHIVSSRADFRVNRDIAQGAAAWLSLHHFTQATQPDANPTRACFRSLRERGYRIVAISGRGASGSVMDDVPQQPTALVFGNELEGISRTAETEADEVRHLPMFGFSESFNLSVAVALTLGALLPHVRQPSLPWELSQDEKQELREAWVRKSLGHRLEMIEREFHRRESSH